MTFKQFQETRKTVSVADFEKETGLSCTATDDTKTCLVYAGNLIIESTEGWDNPEGKWYLVVERNEYITDDLDQLERILYRYASNENLIEATEWPSLWREDHVDSD